MQQCRLLKIPSPQVLERYRLGQAPRLSATQQERAALIANIQYSLTAGAVLKDRAWAWVHAPRKAPQSAVPFERSTRFLRGRIIDRLRDVPARESLAVDALQHDLSSVVPSDRLHEIPSVVDALERDGIVTRSAHSVRLS